LNKTKLTAVSILLLTALAVGATPERSKGISMHLLPKRVADLSGSKWGLTVSAADYLTPDAGSTTLQTGAEFRSFVRKQSSSVKQNGVWIVVTTNLEAYSKSENTFLEQVMSICAADKIPLFICRASNLPDGWKRYDRLD
jgi:hypothetical protein